MKSGYKTGMMLNTIRVSGVLNGPSQVTVNGQTAAFQYDADGKVFSDYILPIKIFCIQVITQLLGKYSNNQCDIEGLMKVPCHTHT